MLFELCNSNAQCSGVGAWQKQQTKHFCTYTGGRSMIFLKLCMVIEGVETIKKWNHFSIQRIVFHTECTENFGVNDRRTVSQQSLRNLWSDHVKCKTLVQDNWAYKSPQQLQKSLKRFAPAGATLYQNVEIFNFWGPYSSAVHRLARNFVWPRGPTVPFGHAKFHLNRCNESPLRGENADFWPVSIFNTGSLPLRGILAVKTKASSQAGQCIPAGYSLAHMLLYVSVVHYNLNSKHTTSYWHDSSADFFTFGKISTANLRILWRLHLVPYSIWWKLRRNLSIIDDAIPPQNV